MRGAKLAGFAVLAGGMLAVGIVAFFQETRAPVAPSLLPWHAPDPMAAELMRCREAGRPGASCQRVWQADRERFLGRADSRR
jgi:conjugative transfer region protein TrbK